jgi:hypothetical protein
MISNTRRNVNDGSMITLCMLLDILFYLFHKAMSLALAQYS